MAVIKYDELFDFPGYTKAIKDAETANKDFGKTVGSIVDRLTKQYNEMKVELGEFTGILKNFNVNQKGAGDALIRTGDSAISAAKKLAEQKRIMNELVGTTDLTTHAVNELKTGLKGLEAEFSSIAGRSDDARAKKAALAAEARRLKAAIKEETEVLKATTKVLEAAEGSYQSLQNEMAAIGRQLKAMPDAFDKATGKLNVNNKAAVDLQTRYLQLNNTLKTADATLGNYQRNVGNYSSAFSGLGNSVNQLTRELPALGINMQTFFLAISNNLPILFDQLGQTRKEIAALKAEGKAAPTVLQALGKAVFSLGTLLSLGVTLLTLYGSKIADFVSGLFKGKKALDETAESQKLFNDALKSTDYTGAIQNVSQLTSEIELAKQGFLDKDEVVKHFNETIGDTIGEVKSLEEAEASLIKNKDAYLQMMLQKAVATAAFAEAAKKSVEAQMNEVKEASDFVGLGDKVQTTPLQIVGNLIPGAKKLAEGAVKVQQAIGEAKREEIVKQGKRDSDLYLKIAEKANEDAARIAKEFGFDFFDDKETKGGEKDAFGKKIKEQQDNLKKLADLAIQQLELQLAKELITEEEFQIKKFGIVEKYVNAAVELENSRKAKTDKGTIAALNKERVQAETEYLNFVNKQNDENRKADLERAKEAIQQEAELKVSALKDEQIEVLNSKNFTDVQREALEIEYQDKVDRILIDALERRIALETDAAKKTTMQLQIEALKRAILTRSENFDDKTLKAQYQARIDAENKYLDLLAAGRDLSFRDQLAHLKRLEEIEKEFAAKGVDITKDAEARKYAEKLLYAEKEKALRQEIESTIISAIETGLQIAQNLSTASFEARISNLEAEREQELAAAGNNANARALIEDKYNKKVAEQKRKQAQADKNFALFQVAISTAQGVAKTIAQWGMPAAIPFIALTLVQGALQAALIASRPIPKFKHGTDNSPEGVAIVDEAGPELIIDRHGRLKEIGGDQGPRYTYLERGSKVIPHGQSKQILRDMEMNNILGQSATMAQVSDRLRMGRSHEMAYAMTAALKSGAISEKTIADAFEKAVRKVPKSDFFFDERGFRKRITEQGDKTTYLNNLTRI